MADAQFAGPVDYLVFSFPEGAAVGEGLRVVLDQVDAGAIEVLDLEVIIRDADGQPSTRALSELQTDGVVDLSVFDGVVSDILDAEDIAGIADALEPGAFAVAIVYEDRSLVRAAAAWAKVGGAELFSGGVDIDDLAQTIDEGNI